MPRARPAAIAARGLPTWGKRRYAEAWQQRAATTGEITYVALGDSAAQGLGASAPDLGYVGLLASMGQQRSGRVIHVHNLSASGAKVKDVLETQVPVLAGIRADIVTCAVGGNDVRRLNPARFEHDLRLVVDALPAHALVADVPCFYGGALEQRARQAAAIARDVIDRAGRVLVELHRATEARTRDEVRGDFAVDMFHPNNRGYTVWAAAFEPAFTARLDAVTATLGDSGPARS